MSGVTETGFDRATVAEITDLAKALIHARIDENLALDETTPEGNIVTIACGKIGEAWEAIEAAYNALDPDGATGDAMVSLAELTGTRRRTDSRATVLTSCTLAAGTYAAQSLVAAPTAAPTNRWRNINEVVATGGAINVAFEAEQIGSLPSVAAGQLAIAETVVGWTAVSNAADSTPGFDLESIEALRARRRREVRTAGSSTLGSIVSAVSQVAGVIDVTGEENTIHTTVDSIPGHGIRINVWDGVAEAANDSAIAQAILSKLAGATPTAVPGGESVTLTTEDGRIVSIGFARTPAVTPTVVVVCTGGDEAAIKAAVAAAHEQVIGADIEFFRVAAAPFSVPGVTGVTSVTIAGGTANIAIGARQVGLITAANVSVNP